MKKKIKEVQDYFKGRIMSGDFEIAKYNNEIVDIDIDGAFFQLCILKGHKIASMINGGEQHFIKIEQLNDKEECELYLVVAPMVSLYFKELSNKLVQAENNRHKIELQKICDLSK